MATTATLHEIRSTRHLLTMTSGTIAATIGEVWPFLGAIGAEKVYAPGVLKSEVVEGTGHGAGSLRKMTTAQGTVVERILFYEPEQYTLGYSYEESGDYPLPAKGLVGVLRLEKTGEVGEKTRVVWELYYREVVEGGVEGLRVVAVEAFQGVVRGLAAVAER